MKRRVISVMLGVAIFGAPLALPLVAHAEDFEQAKVMFSAGAQAYDAGQYPVAIQAFQEAYKAAARPSILFSLAQAERKQFVVSSAPGDLRSSVAHYRQYLEQMQAGGRRNDATTALAELAPQLAQLDAQSAPPASSLFTGDGGAAPRIPPAVTATEPPKTRLFVTSSTPGAIVSVDGAKGTGTTFTLEDAKPGAHKVHVAAEGFVDADRDAIVTAGGTFFTQDVELVEKPGILSLACADGADVTIDGRLVATTPLNSALEVPPGAHYLVVTKNGHKAFSRAVTLQRGKTLDVAVTLDRSGQRTASLVLFGTGAAVVVAGGVFAAVALVEQGRAQHVLDEKAQGNIHAPDIDTYNSAIDLRDRWKTVSTITFGAGLAVLATGFVFYAFDKPSVPPAGLVRDSAPKTEPAKRPDAPAPMEISAAPMVGPGMFGLTIGGKM